jgi:nitrogen regulatory protein PII
MQQRKKVEIVIDEAAAEAMVKAIAAAGARGHTLLRDVEGKGDRGVRASDIFSSHNSLIITVVDDETAKRVVDAAMEILQTRAGVVFVSDVEVVRPGKF